MYKELNSIKNAISFRNLKPIVAYFETGENKHHST